MLPILWFGRWPQHPTIASAAAPFDRLHRRALHIPTVNTPSPADTTPPWPDLWLLRACSDIAPAEVALASDIAADTAWEAMIAAGVDSGSIQEIACRITHHRIADLANCDPELAAMLPYDVAIRYGVVPVAVRGATLEVACSNPLQPNLEQDLAFASGRRIRLSVAAPPAIRESQARFYARETREADQPRLLSRVDVPGVPVAGGAVATLDWIVGEALHQRASDIHLEPKENGLLVRLRVDGSLLDAARVDPEIAAPLVSRLKVLAGLDIADRIRPQDGRASTTFQGRNIDLRISTLPLGGRSEKVVVRILDSRLSNVNLERLGFSADELQIMQRLLRLKEGMVLVTGPTGSGKTTTLYSSLRYVQSVETNLVTVEDPIEYQLEGINQVQVNEKAGLTFAAALRSILRQDPDVVLVGEIRDLETADIALKASMTGHLVLTTLHTNDAPSAIGRLIDIGAEHALLSAAVKGVIAQRLVRRLCPSCSKPRSPSELSAEQLALLAGLDLSHLRRPVGCEECRGSGYYGRIVVTEILTVTTEIQRAIARQADVTELCELGRQGGMRSLWESGLERVLDGSTSVEELLENVAPPIGSNTLEKSEIGALFRQILGERGNEEGAAASVSQSDIDALFEQLPLALAAPAPAAKQEAPEFEPEEPVEPAVQETPVRRAAPPAPRGAFTRIGVGTGTRVLLVDDDRDARRALRRELEAEGIRVVEAADGEAALAYAGRLGFDAVITEITLPRLDGIGLLQALQQQLDRLPVLVYTTQTDDQLLEWARELGAADAVTRPIDIRALIARIPAVVRSAA